MVRTQVSFDAGFYRAARLEAQRQGISFAEFCRRALTRAMAQDHAGPPWMRFSGALRSGDPDASRSVDSVVYGRHRP